MAERKVSVLITAKDAVTGVLRGITKETKSWSESVTKIAAGIGIADSFKELGRFIRDSIGEAAAAYPKLGAGLKALQTDFSEFRIQAGAAFLEVLQPAVPLLRSLVGWAIELARQLPNAFDGATISLVEMIGWLKKLPSFAQQAFGGVAAAAGSVFGQTGLTATGIQAQAGAGDRIKAIDADTAARVAGIAGRRHDLGPRALSKDAQAAADKAARERQAFIDKKVEEAQKTLAIQLAGTSQRDIARTTGAERVDAGELPKTLEDTTAGALSLHEAFSLIGEVTPAVAEGLDAINNSLLASIPGFGIVAKVAQKAVQVVAKVEGAIAIAKGGVKLAESIWPFNPAGIASGTKMIAEGTRLAALGGGGGGGGHGGGGGGGGSLGPNGFVSSSQQSARPQEVRIRAEPGAMIDPNSPAFMRTIAQTVAAARYARLIEIDLTGAG